MKKTYYMNFKKEKSSGLDKIGGLPSHLPDSFPKSDVTGNQLGFLLQLYCDDKRLKIEDALCLQIYQSVEINQGDDPMPVVVKVLKNAKENKDQGTTHPDIEEYSINWEEGEEPDILPYSTGLTDGDFKMLSSKLNGAIPAEYGDRNDVVFLGWINEYPVEFNFAGLLVLLKDLSGNVFCEVI